MLQRTEILRRWRAALSRLETGAADPSTATHRSEDRLPGHRQCAQKVLRYLIARYQDDKCWGPFRGPSGGRLRRTYRKPAKATDTQAPALELSPGRQLRTGEQIRPALENIRRNNDAFRGADDPPLVQFRLITLLALMTALSVVLAAVQHGPLTTIAVALLLGGFTYWYGRFFTPDEKSR